MSKDGKADGARIAILLPCYNEAATIGKVVADFRRELPDAAIYAFDNNSTDGSADLALQAGASVVREPRQGKGFVVRHMFREIDADVYVMADADDTYPAEAVHKLVAAVLAGGDMVAGDRLSSTYVEENKRFGHGFGNTLVCFLVRLLWHSRVRDVMTGYRAFSRRFVKTCPVLSSGFEIETEMTLHTLDKRLNLVEMPVLYRDRPKGSVSKLNTVADGFRVLWTIFNIFRYYRPMAFFGFVGLAAVVAGIAFAVPVFREYFNTGLVPRFPTLISACFLVMAGILSFSVGFILDALKRQSDSDFELELNRVR